MATYRRTFSNNSQYRLNLIVTPGTQSIPNNTTVVSYRIEVEKLSGSGYWASGSFPWSVNIDGNTRSGSISSYDFRSYTKLTLSSGSFTISHNSNGTKSISVKASFTGSSSLGTATASGSENIKTIPRASTVLTFNNFTIGNNIPWSVDRKHAAFTHTVRLVVSGTTIATATSQGASGTLGINASAKTAILNKLSSTSKNVAATLQVDTFNGSTKIGTTQSKTATGIARDVDIKPSASITNIAEGASGLSAFVGTFVQNKSRLNVKSNGTGQYGATIKEYRVTIDSVHYYGSNITSSVVSRSGSLLVTLRVMDTRNVTETVQRRIDIEQYYNPKITVFTASRYPTQESTDLRVTYAFDIAPVAKKNNKRVIIRYRRVDQYNTNVINSTESYSLPQTAHISPGVLNSNYSYEVDIILQDSFNTGDNVIMTAEIGTGWEFINFNASGKGLAFGKVSEISDGFEVNMNTHLLKDVKNKDGIEFIALGGTVVPIEEE